MYKQLATAITAAAAAAVVLAPAAHADGDLSPSEDAYVAAYGRDAVCPVIDTYHSTAGVIGVKMAIIKDGYTADDAVDIINASVALYCPRNWPLLVAIGKAARAATAAAV